MKDGSSRQFEEALTKLETIVGLLEGEEVSLDDALKRYEEGIKLARFCTKKLQEAEKRIEILIKDKDGKISRKAFKDGKELESNAENQEGLLF